MFNLSRMTEIFTIIIIVAGFWQVCSSFFLSLSKFCVVGSAGRVKGQILMLLTRFV